MTSPNRVTPEGATKEERPLALTMVLLAELAETTPQAHYRVEAIARHVSEAADTIEALTTEVGELREALSEIQGIVSDLRRVPTDCWGNPDVASRDWPTEEERGRGLARIAEILESASPPPTVEGEG